MWDMCQMLNIWHISHTKHKNQLLSDVAYVPKLYHICPYRCKFATVWTNMVKPNNVLYLLLSLLSLPVLTLDFFSLSSHIRPKLPSTTQQRKNKMTLWSDPRRSRSSSWARPLRSDHRHRHCRRRRKWHGRGHSDHRHSDRIIVIIIVVGGTSGMGEATPIIHIVIVVIIAVPILPISLSLFFGGWLFWLLVVGWFWLTVVGWSGCGCEILVDIGVWVWVDRVG